MYSLLTNLFDEREVLCVRIVAAIGMLLLVLLPFLMGYCTFGFSGAIIAVILAFSVMDCLYILLECKAS